MTFRPDQCPKCGSLDNTTWYSDGRRYDPWDNRAPLWDEFHCRDCKHAWPFVFVRAIDREQVAQFSMEAK